MVCFQKTNSRCNSNRGMDVRRLKPETKALIGYFAIKRCDCRITTGRCQMCSLASKSDETHGENEVERSHCLGWTGS